MTPVSPAPPSSQADLNAALSRLEPISLSEMDAVKLLNRVDTKYVFPRSLLPQLLSKLGDEYRCLSVNDGAVQAYRTVYYDTVDATMYRMHHNGYARRMKIRKRWYVDSDLAFLEVKRRDNKKRTRKSRTRLTGDENALLDWAKVHTGPFDFAKLTPSTWTDFNRITLVDRGGTERVTIDADISWSTGDHSDPLAATAHPWRRATHDFCIAELKQHRGHARTPCMGVLRDNRIKPASFSKYCVGTALLHPDYTQGNFKPTLRAIGGLRP